MMKNLPAEIVAGTDVNYGDYVVPLWIGLVDKDLSTGEHWEEVIRANGEIIVTHSKFGTTKYGSIHNRTFIRRLR
jgi:hypothetical protein